MAVARSAPCGTWRSPISAELVVSRHLGLGDPRLHDGALYWLESRPREAGRTVLVAGGLHGAEPRDLTPPPFDVRSRVHEYGGGAYVLCGTEALFAHDADQRLYRVPLDASRPPEPVTPEGPWRYADGVADTRRRRIICVREDHGAPGEAVNTLVSVPLDSGPDAGEALAGGHDFYAAPRLSPDGKSLAWLAWRHPQMPWDGTELWVAGVDPDGRLRDRRQIAGGPRESIVQPLWAPDGGLHFVSDRTGDPEIFVTATSSQDATQLTHRPGPDLAPAWRPEAGE